MISRGPSPSSKPLSSQVAVPLVLAALFALGISRYTAPITATADHASSAMPATVAEAPPGSRGEPSHVDETRRNAATIARLFPRSEAHDFDPPKVGSYHLARIKPAGDGEVIDFDGRVTSLAREMQGRITVLSFIYTLCSDTKGCPLATATLFDSHDASLQLPQIARNARFISLSFDPERDTPEAMASYGYPVIAEPDYGDKLPWKFFTTSGKDKLQPILDAYGQTLVRDTDGTIAHLLRLYLIDRSGVVRNIYGLGFLDPRLLFADIETLLLEERSSALDSARKPS